MTNHEELFPNRKSKLVETDPELIEVFDNFDFDEVLGYGNLDPKTRLMVILASMIACQALAEYKVMLGGAERIDKMYADAPANQIHIQKNLSANCFGDYVIRGGVDGKTRELLTISMLLSLGGCEPQLEGHIQTNVNVGNDKQTMLSVVTQLLPYVGYPRTLNAVRCINEVLPE